MSHVCLAGWPAILHCKNFYVGHYIQNFQPFFSHTDHAYRHHCFLPFYISFIDLDIQKGAQGQHKVKPLGLIFSILLQPICLLKTMLNYFARTSKEEDTMYMIL